MLKRLDQDKHHLVFGNDGRGNVTAYLVDSNAEAYRAFQRLQKRKLPAIRRGTVKAVLGE